MNVTVFYAWQDDRPGKVTRYLIRDAAQAACHEITEDSSNDYNLTLDQDTAGRPGMCDIPNAILEKIRDCDIFLADLTFVGNSETKAEGEKAQLIPNPNVTLELGYAVGSKASEKSDGFDRVIAVMNTAYGEPKDQMFDIKRRHPITYKLPAGSTDSLQRIQKSLASDIKNALLTILEMVVVPRMGKDAAERFYEIRAKLESDVRKGQFHGLYHPSSTITVALVPDVVTRIDYQTLDSIGVPFFGLPGGGTRERSGKSVRAVQCTRDPKDQNAPRVRCAITEATIEGVVLGTDVFTLCSDFHQSNAPQNIVPSIAFEEEIISTVVLYTKLLGVLKIATPWRLGISLLEVRGFSIYAGPLDVGRPYAGTDILADPIIIRHDGEVSSVEAVGRMLKSTFDYIWREFGFSGSKNYNNEGNWSPRR